MTILTIYFVLVVVITVGTIYKQSRVIERLKRENIDLILKLRKYERGS